MNAQTPRPQPAAPPSTLQAPALETRRDDAASRRALLVWRYGSLPAPALISAMLKEFPGRIALVSSFGTSSAVLLHMVAQAAPQTPVLFLQTGKLFGETLRYRDRLVGQIGLTDVRALEPDTTAIARLDPDGALWASQPDLCCRIRKVEPLERALAPFDAWITGRRRDQGGLRAQMPLVEADAGRIKINPLADWTRADIASYMTEHALPPHPLEADGYLSIGCMPCTDRVAPGEDPRAGRWRTRDKTECGIHLASALRHLDKDLGVDP